MRRWEADGDRRSAAACGRISLGQNALTAHRFDRELHSTVRELAQMVDRICIAGVDAMGRAQLTGERKLVRCHVEHDERISAGGTCSEESR